MINGMLWIARTGAPWRDLPERYGKWQTVSSRFYRWRQAGIWIGSSKHCSNKPTVRGNLTGQCNAICRFNGGESSSTLSRGKRGEAGTEALGRSQGGLSTKVHLRAEGSGKPMRIVITPGQRHETVAL